MMTTMAALMGTLPIALGWGAGAEARRPLGLAVVGGLLVSQTLTLYVTPVFYIYMEKLQELFARAQSQAARAPSPRAAEPRTVTVPEGRRGLKTPPYSFIWRGLKAPPYWLPIWRGLKTPPYLFITNATTLLPEATTTCCSPSSS